MIAKFDFCFLIIAVSIPNDYTRSFAALFFTIFLSLASDVIASHSSFDRLEYPSGLSMASNKSDSTWLKKTSQLGWPLGGFRTDLGAKAGMLLKSEVGSFQKYI